MQTDDRRVDWPTLAEVLRKTIGADRASGSIVRPAWRIEYRFAPPGAAAVTATAEIDAGLWQRLGAGDPVELVYLPSDPSVHRVEGQQSGRVTSIIFGFIFLLFAPLGAWLMRNGLPRAPAPQGVPPGLAARLTGWFAKSPALALGVAGLLFFLPFAGAGVFWFAWVQGEASQFEARGQSVEGLLLSKEIVRRSGGSSSGPGRSRSETIHYQITYRYRADGDELHGTSEIDADIWERLKEREPIAVRYVGGSPWIHTVEGTASQWVGPIIFLGLGGIGMLVSGVAAWWGWRYPPKRQKTPPRAAEAGAILPAAPPRTASRIQGQPSGWGVAVGALFFFAGSAAFVEGVQTLTTERRYAADSRLVDARITEKKIQEAQRSGRTRTEYVAVYGFDTPEGKVASGQAVLQVSAWESARPGERIRVRYLPDEPQVNRAAGEGGWSGPVVLLIIGPLFALIGAALAWLTRPARWRKPA